MKHFKTFTLALLLSSLCSTTWASSCPNVTAIKSTVVGKKVDRMSFDSGTYTALWWDNFETYSHVWGFSVSNVEANNEINAYEKIQKALPTLSGTPEAKTTRWGVECTYNIGYGYVARASRLSM